MSNREFMKAELIIKGTKRRRKYEKVDERLERIQKSYNQNIYSDKSCRMFSKIELTTLPVHMCKTIQ